MAVENEGGGNPIMTDMANDYSQNLADQREMSKMKMDYMLATAAITNKEDGVETVAKRAKEGGEAGKSLT